MLRQILWPSTRPLVSEAQNLSSPTREHVRKIFFELLLLFMKRWIVLSLFTFDIILCLYIMSIYVHTCVISYLETEKGDIFFSCADFSIRNYSKLSYEIDINLKACLRFMFQLRLSSSSLLVLIDLEVMISY
jgi:hypothetical protein